MAKKEEDVVDTGNVINGQKTGYIKKRAISPLHESINAYKDVVTVNESYELAYDSYSKIATLYEEGHVLKQMRVTNTDWELFHEEVVDQMMEGIDEND